MTTLTVVTFEPETIGVYIDGELHKRGESYMEARILRELLVSDQTIDEAETKHVHPEQWRGMPDTLDELENTYE
jgi:hypothetical protein